MPQFDIYSFFSQNFWVFLIFTFLYSSLTYYLLPAISTTLKVRKRKLFLENTPYQATGLSSSSSNFITSFVSIYSIAMNGLSSYNGCFLLCWEMLMQQYTQQVVTNYNALSSCRPFTNISIGNDFISNTKLFGIFISAFHFCFLNIALFQQGEKL